MKTLSVSLAALVVAGMTAIPAAAQTTLSNESAYDAPDRTVVEQLEKRYYDADRTTYGILDEDGNVWMVYNAEDDSFVRQANVDEYEPYEPGYAEVTFGREHSAQDEPDQQLSERLEKRYYTEDRASYAIFDPVKSVWNVFDATTDAFVEMFDEDGYEPYEAGYEEVTFARGDLTTPDAMAQDEPDLTPSERMQAGMAEERYYDADRSTYAVWDADTGMWSIHDAKTEAMIETRSDAEYTRYEPGYTVIVPGEMQTGMGTEGESIADDTPGISDNRE